MQVDDLQMQLRLTPFPLGLSQNSRALLRRLECPKARAHGLRGRA
jgi:hypothetical protein